MRPKPRYQPGDKIGGRYQVHQVKMGGMGEVYLCLDLEQMYPYALKTFQQRYQSQALRKAFEKEVATWVALEKHPNIVRCHYLEIIDNQPFMLLEWIASDENQGTDLRSWLRHGPLELRLALDFTIDICRSLVYANEKQPGIVHRDLKPDNVLVARGPLAKITDFGLVQVVQEAGMEVAANREDETEGRQSLLGQGRVVGTPPYMAPEQWRGETPDARTDIYAVGCILHELLTGGQPYRATTIDGLRRQHLEADIPKLAGDPDVSDSLDTLLSSCLAKQREERPVTADDLLQHLTVVYQQQFSEPPKAISASGGFTAQDYMNRGITYERLHRYEESLADHNRALELDPEAALIYNNRGNTLAKLHRHEEALADHNRAVELNPTSALAYANRGQTYQELDRFDEALADFDHAIQIDPAYALVYLNRGVTYERLQHYREALTNHTHAIQLNPTFAQAYFNRGVVFSALRRYDEALADYTRAVQLDPAHTHAYYNRGALFARLGYNTEAVMDYSSAIQFDPTEPAFFYNRGNAYSRLGQHTEAVEDFTRVIELTPTNAAAYTNRGNSYEQLGRYDEALVDNTRAIQLEPTSAQAYFNRGNVYLALQLDEQAMADYARAIEIDPTYVSAYVNVGVMYAQRGKLAEALPYFDKAAKLGDSESAHYALRARQELGITSAQPRETLERAIDVFLNVFFQANSYAEMKQAAEQYPFMTQPELVSTVEQIIAQQTPPELWPEFEQRLIWLRQIASEQRGAD